MSAQHTPGIWYAAPPSEDEEDDFRRRYFWSVRYREPDGGGAQIAQITSLNTGHEEANARLIAAAPELLQALGALMGLESRGRIMPVGKEWDAARAVLSKIEGTAA